MIVNSQVQSRVISVWIQVVSAIKSTYTLWNICPLLIQNPSVCNNTALFLCFCAFIQGVYPTDGTGKIIREVPTLRPMHYTLYCCTGLNKVASEISHGWTISRACLPFSLCKGVALCPRSPLSGFFMQGCGRHGSFVTMDLSSDNSALMAKWPIEIERMWRSSSPE